MNAEIVHKRKWFMPWQDEKEEAWLREMSQQGRHLQSVGMLGSYRFVRGEPADHVYRLDFQASSKGELEDYLQLFDDAGWEHVGEMGAWHYFRRPVVAGQAPEIFTDVQSKIQKYQRVQAYFLIFFSVEIAVSAILLTRDHPWIAILFGIHAVFLVIFGLLFFKVSARIAELRKVLNSTGLKAGQGHRGDGEERAQYLDHQGR